MVRAAVGRHGWLAVAGALAGDFQDGACLVELASITDSTLVPQALASALGVKERVGSAGDISDGLHTAGRIPQRMPEPPDTQAE